MREDPIHGLFKTVSGKRKKRWYQFRITTLLVVMAMIAAWLGFYFSPVKRRGRAVEALERLGFETCYDYQLSADSAPGHFSYLHVVEPPGPTSARWLFGKEFFQTADYLHFTGGALSADDLKPLERLWGLRNLSMQRCKIGDEHMAHLQGLSRLEVVMLGGDNITDRGIAYLGAMPNLRSLSIPDCKVSGSGLQGFASLGNLENLFLQGNPVDDKNLEHLSGCVQLQMLGLGRTNVSDAGLVHLQSLQKLRYVGLMRTKVTVAGVRDLQSKLPNCTIEY